MPSPRPLLLSAALLAAIAGCRGHGGYTAKHINVAKEKMDMMKAGTEWQTAKQAFLGGDLDKAKKHVDISLTLNPKVVKSHVLRGRIMLESGNLEEAANSFARAEELDPKAVDPQYYMGLLNERVLQREEALARYQKAAELDAANPQYAIAAAEVLIDLGRLGEAKSYLESRRSSFEHNAGVRQTLAHIAMMEGDPRTAAALFNEARLLAPNDLAILEDLARAQMAAGDTAEAEFTLSRLLQNPATAPRRDLKRMRADCLVQIDRTVEARELLLELTRDDAGASDAETWIALGNVSFLMGDWVRLRQCATRTVALAPARPEGHLLKALHARATGDGALAATALRDALAIRPDAATYALLGTVQRDLGRAEEARASFAQALRLDPQAEGVAELMAGVSVD